VLFKQRNDFGRCVGIRRRLARVNVEFEQCAHAFDFFVVNGEIQRCVTVVIERVLVDTGRAQQLDRVRFASVCGVLKCSETVKDIESIFSKIKDFELLLTHLFLARFQSCPKP
jgi:hypothetical protein